MKWANVFFIGGMLLVVLFVFLCKRDFEALNAITNSNAADTLTKGDGADSNVSFDFLPTFVK
jgi:hypothetical protein